MALFAGATGFGAGTTGRRPVVTAGDQSLLRARARRRGGVGVAAVDDARLDGSDGLDAAGLGLATLLVAAAVNLTPASAAGGHAVVGRRRWGLALIARRGRPVAFGPVVTAVLDDAAPHGLTGLGMAELGLAALGDALTIELASVMTTALRTCVGGRPVALGSVVATGRHAAVDRPAECVMGHLRTLAAATTVRNARFGHLAGDAASASPTALAAGPIVGAIAFALIGLRAVAALVGLAEARALGRSRRWLVEPPPAGEEQQRGREAQSAAGNQRRGQLHGHSPVCGMAVVLRSNFGGFEREGSMQFACQHTAPREVGPSGGRCRAHFADPRARPLVTVVCA